MNNFMEENIVRKKIVKIKFFSSKGKESLRKKIKTLALFISPIKLFDLFYPISPSFPTLNNQLK